MSWKFHTNRYTRHTHMHVYEIRFNGDRWELRVRTREEPEDVPIDDLWHSLGTYHNPEMATIHADYLEEKSA